MLAMIGVLLALVISSAPAFVAANEHGAAASRDLASIGCLQYDALQQIYLATNMGSDESLPFHNWSFDGECTNDDQEYSLAHCSFTGVVCDETGHITILELDDAGLSGTLPDAISMLYCLKRLRMHNNSIGGTIPQSLLQLPDLSNVNLGHNNFIGTFPDLSNLSSLNRMVLHSNLLSGTIPTSLCTLTDLKALDFGENANIWGEIPDCFGSLTALSTLRISDTNLQGTIPAELCGVRDMNSFIDNTFGCEAIACPPGTFQPIVGRRTTFEPCQSCSVDSNALGSTTCRLIETPQPTTAITTAAPVSVPSPTGMPSPNNVVDPTNAPSMFPYDGFLPGVSAPSSDPTISSTTTQQPTTEYEATGPTVQPQEASPGLPSSIPTSSLPTQPPDPSLTGVESSSVESTGNDAERNGFIAVGAFAFVAIFAAMAFFAWKRRSSFSRDDSASIDEEQIVLDKVTEQAPPIDRVEQAPPIDRVEQAPPFDRVELAPPFDRVEQAPPFDRVEQAPPIDRADGDQQRSNILDQELERVEASQGKTIIPVSTRMPSILKTDTAKYTNADRVEEAQRRVRFNIPPLPPAFSFSTSGGDRTSESSYKKAKENKGDQKAWMSWINPIFDPIQACTTGDCRGYMRKNDDEPASITDDPELASGSSFDSSITSLSQLLDQYPSSSDAVATVSRTDAKWSKWRKLPPPPPPLPLVLPPSPPSPGLEAVLGIRDRSVVDEERKSVRMVCGTDTTLRSLDTVFRAKGRRQEDSVGKGGYVEEAMMNDRISITPDMVEL